MSRNRKQNSEGSLGRSEHSLLAPLALRPRDSSHQRVTLGELIKATAFQSRFYHFLTHHLASLSLIEKTEYLMPSSLSLSEGAK